MSFFKNDIHVQIFLEKIRSPNFIAMIIRLEIKTITIVCLYDHKTILIQLWFYHQCVICYLHWYFYTVSRGGHIMFVHHLQYHQWSRHSSKWYCIMIACRIVGSFTAVAIFHFQSSVIMHMTESNKWFCNFLSFLLDD